MTDTSIEWCHRPGTRAKTWNPTDGCEVCSPGCANCYAMRMAGRFSAPGRPYHGLVTIAKNKRAIWNGQGRFNVGRLALPLSWKAPCTVFVNSMSDLFYDAFTDEQIAAVFGVMAATPRHHYIVLTKRAARMRAWFEWSERSVNGGYASTGWNTTATACRQHAADALGGWSGLRTPPVDSPHRWIEWPLPNVILGVSVENQKHGVPRIELLRRTPAAVRMLSIEPLIEDLGVLDLDGIGWVVVGCESGPGARPMDPRWVRSIRNQCAAAGVPFFLKQATDDVEICDEGCGQRVRYTVRSATTAHAACGCTIEGPEDCGPVGVMFGPGSHRKAGGVIGAPYLDGMQHLAFPAVTP